tara:strand:- start:254 stop:898 length:645 start_codon:yes stop_codon:yes gene_type:complete
MGTTFSSGFLTEDKRYDARIFALHEGANVFSANPGNLSETGLETDVAIRGGGFFIIQPDTGGPALSRRGDFEVSDEGELTDGAGSKILDANLTPINIPPHKKIVVSENGDLFIEPLGEPDGTRVLAATIALTSGSEKPLHKDTDGQIRLIEGGIPGADQNVVLAQGFIENSNVNAIEELVDTLGQQRLFEINVKFIALSEQIDEGGASIMRLPN